ncbi:MAG: hypothetical protein ACLQOO_13110 [Terriglobia bacterium]
MHRSCAPFGARRDRLAKQPRESEKPSTSFLAHQRLGRAAAAGMDAHGPLPQGRGPPRHGTDWRPGVAPLSE